MALKIIIPIYLVVTTLFIKNLWEQHPRDSSGKKILWTIILLVPFLGWLFYGGVYEPPSSKSPSNKTPASGWDTRLNKPSL